MERFLLHRRDFLIAAGAAAGALGLRLRGASAGAARTLVLSPEDDVHPARSLGVLDLAAGRHTSIPTNLLGHSIVGDPAERRRVVMVAQRPGTRSCVADLEAGEVVEVFESKPGRHFYGHGAFSGDGSLFFATENDYETGAGVVSVRDGRTFEPLGEMPSHGVGPHEMRPAGAGQTLHVANGGVRTDPRREDVALDLEAMAPSFCTIDASSGKLLGKEELPEKRLSIRHFDATPEGDLAIGLRHYGPDGPKPCVALRERGGRLAVAPAPPGLVARMKSEALSVAIHRGTRVAGCTHPDGNVVTLWSLPARELAGTIEVDSPQGITVAPDDAHFLVTTTSGRMLLVPVGGGDPKPLEHTGLDWKHSLTWTPGAGASS